jgi:hypothetical protein
MRQLIPWPHVGTRNTLASSRFKKLTDRAVDDLKPRGVIKLTIIALFIV